MSIHVAETWRRQTVHVCFRLFMALCVATALLSTPTQWVYAARSSSTVTLNFVDTDIDASARAMATITGRSLILDPRVKGRMTLYTDEPIKVTQAWTLFVSSLRGMGYAVVEMGGLLKVVPEADAKTQAGVAVTNAPPGDSVVTQVIPVTHQQAADLVTVLRPLISSNNTITVSAGNNALVITDYTSNLSRLATLIGALDIPSATDVEVFQLQHTQASTVAATVQRLLDTAPATGGTSPGANGNWGNSVVLADTSLNALVVRAANPARLASIRALVARLDRPGGASGSVHVHYLQHAEAVRLAAVLRAAFPLTDSSRSGASAPVGGPSVASASPSPLNSAGATGASSGENTAPVTATAAPSAGGYIQADPASNALIVTAPEPLWRDIQAVIAQLDQRRAQLYVESLVAEVDASRSRDIGVKWPQILGISQSSLSTVSLGTIASALESQAGSNILSNANIVTLDNEEAKIAVGQNVPFVTGSYTTTSGTSSNPFQTIDRKDVGITLRIKPQISANGQIRLTIFQESSSVASTSSSAGPTTNKRSIETSVVVTDGKFVVLGGLIEDSWSVSNDEMPGLSKIPVLGTLFRANSRTRRKSNLVVFLRPHVMRDETTSNRLSIDRYDLLRADQTSLPSDPRDVLRDAPMPALPAP